MAQEAVSGAARHHWPVAGIRPVRTGIRRSRAVGLPVPGAVVDLPGPVNPAQDDPSGAEPAGGVLAGPHAGLAGAAAPAAPARLRASCRPPIASSSASPPS